MRQPLGLLQIHAFVLAPPALEALGADVVLATDLLSPMPSIGLPQYPDYLFGRAYRLFHR